jgi:hypothetical protein
VPGAADVAAAVAAAVAVAVPAVVVVAVPAVVVADAVPAATGEDAVAAAAAAAAAGGGGAASAVVLQQVKTLEEARVAMESGGKEAFTSFMLYHVALGTFARGFSAPFLVDTAAEWGWVPEAFEATAARVCAHGVGGAGSA